MRNKAILCSLLLAVSGSVLADQSLLADAATLALKNKAASLRANVVNKTSSESQLLEQAKDLKASVENAPDPVKNQIRSAIQQKLDAAGSHSGQTINGIDKQKAAEKLLQLLQ